ncbi:MAG: 2-dehydropantoate 2-reductase [Ectothiorhodospiraceae bacterium]|nr:2-dehydropantoate 2-reductase [Ectothiorhodospiraceae bacterium]
MDHRIAIVGAGAVGSYVGGYLARDGRDVVLVDPWPEHVATMNARGLRLSGMSNAECFETPVRAIDLSAVQGLSRERPFDIVLVCMKSYDTAWAARLLLDHMAPNGFVVSLQNCINEPVVAEAVGWGRTVGCIAAKISVELTGPGEVKRGVAKTNDGVAVFRVGEVHGRETPRVRAVAEMLASVDGAKVTTNLWGERWTKLVANAMKNGVCAASGMTANACDREPVTRWLSIRLAGEAVRVGLAQGYAVEKVEGYEPAEWMAALDGDAGMRARIEESMLASTAKRSEAFIPSMAQDVNKGRRTEIEHMNGLVVRLGRESGIECPANAGLMAAVRSIERGEARPALDLLRGV